MHNIWLAYIRFLTAGIALHARQWRSKERWNAMTLQNEFKVNVSKLILQTKCVYLTQCYYASKLTREA